MEKNFNPSKSEKIIYDNWLNKKYFSPNVNDNSKSYSISMPPPNITGELHMGHALNATLQDILIRFKRMQGYNTLWVPGCDHASISTEMKIVNSLQNTTKEEIGREAFLKMAWEWKEKYGSIISSQLKQLGVSCDWERERFTLDDGLSDAVLETFINLYKKGYIYKGNRLINWCPHCKTTISDAEVEHKENNSKIYHMKYKIKGSRTYLTFATTRPETILADVALAVNPKDTRYINYVGKTVIVPIVNREIPIIQDDYVSMEFGTGIVKITPGHDFNDYEIGIRHNLNIISILNDNATINKLGGEYEGLDRYEARKKIIQHFKDIGQFHKEEDIQNSIGIHDKCGSIMEPLIKLQWFVKMDNMSKPAIQALAESNLTFIPSRFSKIYLNWLENIKDWCISRQLWWGHRIPAYYCNCGHTTIAKHATACEKCNSTNITQDEDVLDTWFSSALWPFSTLGWPNNTNDLNKYFPTSVLVTGPDIIFFWVVRMVFSSLEQTNKVPFKDVILHGIIRDENGQKMSKSLGNGINPLEIIKDYGADSLRLTLIIGSALGNDQRFSKDKVQANRNFLNKVWNAARFIKLNSESNTIAGYSEIITIPTEININNLNLQDMWILNKLNKLVEETTINMENYDLGIALQKIYDFTWDEYCDWYIEMCKANLRDETKKQDTLIVLNYILNTVLRLLHPYAPFITEEIFKNIQNKEDTIVLAKWPNKQNFNFTDEEIAVDNTVKAIKTIRNIRQQMNVAPSKKIKITIVAENDTLQNFVRTKNFFTSLSNAQEVNVTDSNESEENSIVLNISGATIYLNNLIDTEKEIARLKKEQINLQKEIERATNMLNNKDFISKAPQKLVDAEKLKKLNLSELLIKVNENLENLK